MMGAAKTQSERIANDQWCISASAGKNSHCHVASNLGSGDGWSAAKNGVRTAGQSERARGHQGGRTRGQNAALTITSCSFRARQSSDAATSKPIINFIFCANLRKQPVHGTVGRGVITRREELTPSRRWAQNRVQVQLTETQKERIGPALAQTRAALKAFDQNKPGAAT